MFETLRMLTSVSTQVNGQFPVCGNHSPCFEVRITILVNQAKCATIAQSFIHVMLFDKLQRGFFLPSFTIFGHGLGCFGDAFIFQQLSNPGMAFIGVANTLSYPITTFATNCFSKSDASFECHIGLTLSFHGAWCIFIER
jgi:hypothetical protein